MKLTPGANTLIKVFWEKYNIHLDWMERIVGYYPDWINEGIPAFRADTKEGKDLRGAYRQRAKNEFVFGTFFGAQAPLKLERLERI